MIALLTLSAFALAADPAPSISPTTPASSPPSPSSPQSSPPRVAGAVGVARSAGGGLPLGAHLLLISTGELRYIGTLPPELTLDAEGTQLGQGPVLDQRLRTGLTLKSVEDRWSVGTEWDLFTGQLAGDTWDVPGTVDERHREELGVLHGRSFLPREAGGSLRVGVMRISAGLTTSHWGLGMLANDGDHDPEFGRTDFGDRVLRLRVGARPFQKGAFPLTVALAGDRVVQDDLVQAGALGPDGQVAWQGVAAVLYAPANGNKLGIYGVYRDQTEPVIDGESEGRKTRIGVVDVYGELRAPVGALQLRLGGEAAEIGGHTNRAETYNSIDGLDILSGGATGFVGVAGPARVRVVDAAGREGTQKRDLWSTRIRTGWASGDADPDDARSNDFTFDRDYDAGMLLFKEQMGGIEAANYALISDPANTGHTPDGAELSVTEGSFRRATFIQPVVEVDPLSWLGVRAGVMAAWSTGPITQPFYTFRNGGSPTNHLNQPTTGRALGTEIDWAVRLGGIPLGGGKERSCPLAPELLLQGAHLFSSADMGGGTATMLTATARARW